MYLRRGQNKLYFILKTKCMLLLLSDYSLIICNHNKNKMSYKNNQIKMATTTPVQNNSALTTVNVTASPSPRGGDILSTGGDTVSSIQQVQLLCQFRRNRIQEYYEAAACVAIRTNTSMIAYLQEVNQRLRRK